MFVGALLQEQQTSARINDLYELAFASKAFSEMAELQWFLTEQVEEEKAGDSFVVDVDRSWSVRSVRL